MTPNRTPDHRLSIEQNDPACFKAPGGHPVTIAAIWDAIEFLVANPNKVDDPQQRITALAQPLYAIQRSPHSRYEIHQASILGASLGPLALRAKRQSPDTKDMQEAEEAGKPVLEVALTHSQVKDRSNGLLTEVVAYQGLLRHGDPHLFPYFTSPREEASPRAATNHDLYVMADSMKIPTQVKFFNSKSGYLQQGVLQVKVERLLNAVPDLARFIRNQESRTRCLARLLLQGNEAPFEVLQVVDDACFFIAEEVRSFITRITDKDGRRLPLDQPISNENILPNLQRFWAYTAHTRAKTFPEARRLQHGDQRVRYNRVTTQSGQSRALRLFDGPRKTFELTLPYGSSVSQVAYSDNVFLRKFLDHPLS